MIYITNDDLLKVITQQELDQITSGTPTALDDAEDTALDMTRDYLIDLYEVEDEFIKTGSARSGSLVSKVVDIMVFLIMQRTAPDNIPVIRLENKDNAEKWFLNVNSGKIKLNGVAKTEPDSGRPIRWGDSITQDIQLNY